MSLLGGEVGAAAELGADEAEARDEHGPCARLGHGGGDDTDDDRIVAGIGELIVERLATHGERGLLGHGKVAQGGMVEFSLAEARSGASKGAGRRLVGRDDCENRGAEGDAASIGAAGGDEIAADPCARRDRALVGDDILCEQEVALLGNLRCAAGAALGARMAGGLAYAGLTGDCGCC